MSGGTSYPCNPALSSFQVSLVLRTVPQLSTVLWIEPKLLSLAFEDKMLTPALAWGWGAGTEEEPKTRVWAGEMSGIERKNFLNSDFPPRVLFPLMWNKESWTQLSRTTSWLRGRRRAFAMGAQSQAYGS